MGRWLLRLGLLLASALALAVLLGLWLLRGSLPALDGELALPGLSAPVSITRDALGVVDIDAASEADAMRALGFVHAQERWFEMDLLRRAPAGELAALFGPRALEVDRRHRVHRIRARVDASLAEIAGPRRSLLDAYAAGANAGRAALRTRPWPYLLVGGTPSDWTAADSALVGYAMYFDLQDASNARELAWARLHRHLPAPLSALLAHDGSRWDAPLAGAVRGDAVLPAADRIDLRTLPAPAALPDGPREPASPVASRADAAPDLRAGSNNFAVAGSLTADGRAIVADDMHLGLRAPNLWFRARLRWPDAAAPGGQVDITGFTLPGLPAVIAGSNGHVAWGFTNSYVDTLDWQRVRPCTEPGDAGADGCTPIVRHLESIEVAGAGPQPLQVDETAWGPILHREPDGTALALRWVAHLPRAIDFGLAEFARARDVDAVLALADRTATPAQNLVVGDRDGQVAWRLLGPLPVRAPGCDGSRVSVPPPPGVVNDAGVDVDSDEAGAAPGDDNPCPPWPIATDAAPVLRSPAVARLWTANNRTLDGAALARLGDGGVALGARAKQIRDALFARDRHDEASLLAIQLDDRALLLAPWWRQLRDAAAAGGDATPAMRALAEAGDGWDGSAGIDAVGYRLLRAWRLAVIARIVDGLTAPARAALGDGVAMPDFPQAEGIAWPLLVQRPAHLLPRRYACAGRADSAGCDDARDGWQALLEDAAAEVRDTLAAQGPLRERSWGERNTAAICHPLAAAVPVLGKRLLCMPAQPLPGDGGMPRVQGPAFGASQRMVIAPGHEADGIAHMPGGQSGHPLSPFWGAGHDDWVEGRASPFLPGETRHRLRLVPAR